MKKRKVVSQKKEKVEFYSQCISIYVVQYTSHFKKMKRGNHSYVEKKKYFVIACANHGVQQYTVRL